MMLDTTRLTLRMHVIPPRIQVGGWLLEMDALSSFGGGIRELDVRRVVA